MKLLPREPWLLALAVLALHLPVVPAALEDLDSINFALGAREFDVAEHQPHPPGYPVYIAVARLASVVFAGEAQALATISAVSAAAAVLAIFVVLRRWLGGEPAASRTATFGTVLVAAAPLFSITSVRPLSDMMGFAAAIAVQASLIHARSLGALLVAAGAAGLAVGIRSQVVWLTLPLLAMTVWQHRRAERHTWVRLLVMTTAAYAVGALLWFIPLVVLSGGPDAYLRALASQGGEDFAGVAMLATQPSPRLLLSALWSTWVVPWGPWPLALVVIGAAAAGLVRAARFAPSLLAILLVAYGPYAAFHLLLQETVTTRYALPLLVPVALLAAYALGRLPARIGGSVTAVVALAAVALTQPALVAYAKTPPPAFRVLADLRAAGAGAAEGAPAPVLAMHRRQALDMRRPIRWDRHLGTPWREQLPAPPKHEWLELVRYWNRGGRAPIDFLADPPRSDLRLIDPQSRTLRGTYRWPLDADRLLGGVRPNVMDWYRIAPPGWYLGEGWALTPETAGVAREDGQSPGLAPIQGWVRRHGRPSVLMIGGRKLSGAEAAPLAVAIDGRPVWQDDVPPGFFLHFVPLEPPVFAGDGDYATLTVRAGSPEVAIEQFDVQPQGTVVYGFGEGWQELEYNPATGRLWRWSSERAVLRVYAPRRRLTLRLEGEFETSAKTAHISVRAGGELVAERDVPRQFALDIPIPDTSVVPGGETRITLETDQWYIPAETNWRPSPDRRHLGLRLSVCEIRIAD